MSKNSQKTKGDKAEREAAALLTELLKPHGLPPVRRALGAGRTNEAGGDVGDIVGVPGHAIQVKAWADERAAAVQGPKGAEEQARNADQPYAATLIRFRGGQWRVVLTPEQFARYIAALYAI